MSAADSAGLGNGIALRAGGKGSLMNAKLLLIALTALHLMALALILGVLGREDQESGVQVEAWQVAEWNPGYVAGRANDAIIRDWSSEYRPLDAMVTDQRSCVNVH